MYIMIYPMINALLNQEGLFLYLLLIFNFTKIYKNSIILSEYIKKDMQENTYTPLIVVN